jgi:hypothetical protein
MPKTLDTFEFPHGGRKGIEYDWDSILDGKIHQLKQGEDFTAEPKTFVGAVARAANSRNLRVKRQIDGKVLVLQAVAKGSAPAEATAS